MMKNDKKMKKRKNDKKNEKNEENCNFPFFWKMFAPLEEKMMKKMIRND